MLLHRAVATLRSGEVLEIRSESDLEDTLRLWCRQEGHGYLARENGGAYRIERGEVSRTFMRPGPEVAESSDASWGLAPRGAAIELGGPEFSFLLDKKREVWANDLETIYAKAVANQWSAAKDIPWSTLQKLPPELEAAVCQIMTFLTENEFAALYVPARFLARIYPHRTSCRRRVFGGQLYSPRMSSVTVPGLRTRS